ncbi:DUF6632 domain-containing protein [Microbulbifer sp. 2304DJ12-6]|uniref:DUF6632 domain-containing protein n=1 Tax=Microbulbifer sp. 2304DJ12-6 TaxID=3233340 RepID=UPI0039AFFFF9
MTTNQPDTLRSFKPSNTRFGYNSFTRVKYLIIAMRVVGLFFIFAIYPLMEWVWPEGWGWIPPQHEYEHIIIGMFATLGVFLVLAATNPIANIILVWFTIWLNLVYATISLLMAVGDETGEQNLIGDIPLQYLIAGVLWYLIPKNIKLLQRLDNEDK